MVRKKALGRGLDALLRPTQDLEESGDESTFQNIDVLDIVPNPNQPRSQFNQTTIDELSVSIAEQGVLQPVMVRSDGDGKFELIAGERRWLAAKQAGIDKIPAIVREVTDRESMVLALIENIQREDLNAFEEAKALQELSVKHELTHQEIAKLVGRSRTAVTNLIRLLQLHKVVLKQLAEGTLEEGHARTLLAIETPKQVVLAAKIAKEGLSVRQAEALVKRIKEEEGKERQSPEKDRDVVNVENELSDVLGVSVSIQSGKRTGTGRMTIRYRNLEELGEVIKRLRRQ